MANNNHAEIEEVLKSEKVYEGTELNVRKDTVELANGSEWEQEIAQWPNEVIVVPQLSEDEVILVKEYRRGAGEILLGLPGGKIKDGEDEISTAKRELEEETGYRAEKFEKLTEAFTAPGWSTTKCTYLLATGLSPVENPHPADPDENIEIATMLFKETWDAVKNGQVRDAKSIIGLLLAKDLFNA